jgi:hypothetical protein
MLYLSSSSINTVVSLIVCLSSWKSPRVLINFAIIEFYSTRFFDVVNLISLTLLSLPVSYKLSFPIVALNISSLIFALKSANKVFISY